MEARAIVTYIIIGVCDIIGLILGYLLLGPIICRRWFK